MKTKQTKIVRSGAKWLPGAMALAATTAGAQAASVQITLNGNKISTTGGNQLFADLTGDYMNDLVVGGAVTGGYSSTFGVRAYVGRGLRAMYFGYYGQIFQVVASFAYGGVGTAYRAGPGLQTAVYLNPMTFSDARINGGATTSGWLEVNAFNTSSNNHTVQLTRLIFDDASTTRPGFASIPGTQTEWTAAVPEPSSLGLLALGAGGLALRRSRKAKAA